ncbi:hypothetical protein KTR9_5291 (plasmid) [Gordonia sp. KTR9]|nr:hypothetical protein KTR9_5291 [Gordonia sp. KTR9]
MATDRKPVTGLARTGSVPGPPPRRPTTPTAAPAATPPVPDGPALPHNRPQPAASTRPVSRGARRPKRVETRPDEMLVSVTLSLPTPLCTATKAHNKQNETTIAGTLMDAIVANHDRLPALVEKLKRQHHDDGLFVRIEARPEEERSSLTFRMLGRNLTVIDRLVVEVGAENRSQLCRAALEAHLQSQSVDSE